MNTPFVCSKVGRRSCFCARVFAANPRGIPVPARHTIMPSFSCFLANASSVSLSISPFSACSWCSLHRLIKFSLSYALSLSCSIGTMWCTSMPVMLIRLSCCRQYTHKNASRSLIYRLSLVHLLLRCTLYASLSSWRYLRAGFIEHTTPRSCNRPQYGHDTFIALLFLVQEKRTVPSPPSWVSMGKAFRNSLRIHFSIFSFCILLHLFALTH